MGVGEFKCYKLGTFKANMLMLDVYSGRYPKLQLASSQPEFANVPLKLKERNIFQMNIVGLKTWREADQLSVYQHDRGVAQGSTEKKLQLLDRRGT